MYRHTKVVLSPKVYHSQRAQHFYTLLWAKATIANQTHQSNNIPGQCILVFLIFLMKNKIKINPKIRKSRQKDKKQTRWRRKVYNLQLFGFESNYAITKAYSEGIKDSANHSTHWPTLS